MHDLDFKHVNVDSRTRSIDHIVKNIDSEFFVRLFDRASFRSWHFGSLIAFRDPGPIPTFPR